MSDEPFRVLVLCTANVCRSPAVAALLDDADLTRARATGRRRSLIVESAGSIAAGVPVDPRVAKMLRALHVDPPPTTSVVVTAELIDASDLIVGMTRDHVRRAVGLGPDAWNRAATLHELGAASRRSPRRPAETRSAWVHRVLASRSADFYQDDPTQNIADPSGRRKRAYVRMFDEIVPLVAQLEATLASPVGPPTATP